MTEPLVTISVLAYGPSPWLAPVVDAVVAHTTLPYELVLVDNGTTAETRDHLARLERSGVRVLRPERNLGFGVGHTAAANVARAPYLCLLNSDAVVPPGWLDALVAPLIADEAVGATAPVFVYPDGRLQEAGATVEPSGQVIAFGRFDAADDPRYRLSGRVPFASAACLVMRTATFRDLGGFDARYGAAYYEDVDLAFALLARSLTVELVAGVQVVHAQGASSAPEDAEQRLLGNRERFRERHEALLTGRPYVFGRAEAHHLAAARDFDACDRVLVVAERFGAPDDEDDVSRFTAQCDARLRDGRVTVLADTPARDDWLARGVEVFAAVDATPLLTARRFHYAAVVTFPPVAPQIDALIRDTQPQARVTAPPDHPLAPRDEFDRWLGSLDLVPRLVW